MAVCKELVRSANDEPYHTYEWVMSHVRMSHVTHTNESSSTFEWVMSNLRTSHVSCLTYKHTHPGVVVICKELVGGRQYWVISHTQMSHIPPMNETCFISHMQTYTLRSSSSMQRARQRRQHCAMPHRKWVMIHLRMSHVQPMNESCLISHI